jgi:hypothetical protein
MDEDDWPKIRRRERAVRLGIGSVRKNPGVANVNSALPAKFRPERDGVGGWPGGRLENKIGLVEEIVAVRCMLIGRSIERGL